MFRKFAVRLFGIIFLPLVACQLPGGQAGQQMELPTPIPTAPPTLAPTAAPTNEASLAFETIELREPSTSERYWQSEEPGLIVITSLDEVEKAKPYVTDEAITTLKQIDYKSFFALLAFHGRRPTVHYDFQILKLVQQNTEIDVVTQPARWSGGDAESSTYHLVKVTKQGVWGSEYTFSFWIGAEKTDIKTFVTFSRSHCSQRGNAVLTLQRLVPD